MSNIYSNYKKLFNELYYYNDYKYKKDICSRISLYSYINFNIVRILYEYFLFKNESNEVKYFFNGNKYKMVLNKTRNVIQKLSKATTINEMNEEIEITKEIKEIAGPLEDFHNMCLTPAMLNYKNICLHVFDTESLEMKELKFDLNDILEI